MRSASSSEADDATTSRTRAADIDRARRRETPLPLEACVLEHLLDHVGEPAPFGFDQIAVPPGLRRLVHDAGRQILRGRPDDGQRRPQFVRHRRDEVHLLRGQPLPTAGR